MLLKLDCLFNQVFLFYYIILQIKNPANETGNRQTSLVFIEIIIRTLPGLHAAFFRTGRDLHVSASDTPSLEIRAWFSC